MGAGKPGKNRKRTVTLIIIVLVVIIIGVGGFLLLQSLLTGFGQAVVDTAFEEGVITEGDTTDDGMPTPAPSINLIVAARDIPRGARLGPQDVTVMKWPLMDDSSAYLIDALVMSDTADGPGLDQVDGRIARTDILTGMPLMNYMLTPGDRPTSLTDVGSDAALLIPSGMVMMSLPIDRFSATGYALREGDHVDVMMSFNFINVDEDFQSLLPNEAVILTDDTELIAAGLQGFQYTFGRTETGPFGSSLLVIPETTLGQLPRQTTSLTIDNAIVMRVGQWPVADLNQPIIVTPAPPPTAVPEGQAGTTEGEFAEEPTPQPTAIVAYQVPDMISLAMSRQDALVMKYAIEMGAEITLVLRSALDDEIAEIVTDPVTLDYIIQYYNVPVPAQLDVAMVPLNLRDLFTTPDETVEETPQE